MKFGQKAHTAKKVDILHISGAELKLNHLKMLAISFLPRKILKLENITIKINAHYGVADYLTTKQTHENYMDKK